LLGWLAKVSASARWTTSVCTGSLLLHTAGVADGRRLATYWGFEDELERRGATVGAGRAVGPGRAGRQQPGVSAGIDMALWLVGQWHSPAHARTTQRYIPVRAGPALPGRRLIPDGGGRRQLARDSARGRRR